MHQTTTHWGGLRCHIVRGSASELPPELAVVLCHGYGAPGTDLVALAEPLLRFDPLVAERVAFVFPEAPLSLAEQGIPDGRAWWPIDLDRLLSNPSPETLNTFRSGTPVGLAEARQHLLQMLDELQRAWNLPWERIVLGGFSQGSMLAIDTSLRLPQPPALLSIFAGATICESDWRELAARRGPLRVLQSHGRFDNILLFSEGTRLRDLLEDNGAQVEFIETPGYHEIGLPALARFAAMLRALCQE